MAASNIETGTGRLVALEGLDGSGTTTQTHAVADALRALGHQVLTTREPTDGPIGRQIRALMAWRAAPPDPDVIALLFAADRLEHLRNEVEPALSRGELVLCDRYVISSWVYQSLECAPVWVRSINAHARWPDHTVLLEIDAAVALDRVVARTPEDQREIYETLEIQQAVARGYAQVLAERHRGVVAVDGAAAPEDVTRRVVESIVRAFTAESQG